MKTPSSLKWLINKKARLEGQIAQLEAYLPSRSLSFQKTLSDIDSHRAVVEEAYRQHMLQVDVQLPKLTRQLEAILTALRIHEIQINPNLIKPISPRSPKGILPRGAITRDTYIFLRGFKAPAPTKEIASFIWVKYGVSEEQVSFPKFTEIVRRRLKGMAAEGKIVSLHPKDTNAEGSWKLPSKD